MYPEKSIFNDDNNKLWETCVNEDFLIRFE